MKLGLTLRVVSRMTSPRLLYSAMRNWSRAVPLMRDRRVPLALKIGAALLAVLIVSPLDVFGDIPILGMLDDALLLTLLCTLFVMLGKKWTEDFSGPQTRNVGLQLAHRDMR